MPQNESVKAVRLDSMLDMVKLWFKGSFKACGDLKHSLFYSCSGGDGGNGLGRAV